jgi:type VI protein secretion system component Hcp
MRIAIVAMALTLALGSPALAGSKGGGPSHSDMPVTKQIDKATTKTGGSSPNLFKNTTTGQHYKKVTLPMR